MKKIAMFDGQQCWALWAFLAACPCMLFIDIISLFINWANKDACLLASTNISLRDDRRSVECCQQISTDEYEYVDNSKRRLRLYQWTLTPKRTEQNLFVRTDKSEAEVTNNLKD